MQSGLTPAAHELYDANINGTHTKTLETLRFALGKSDYRTRLSEFMCWHPCQHSSEQPAVTDARRAGLNISCFFFFLKGIKRLFDVLKW